MIIQSKGSKYSIGKYTITHPTPFHWHLYHEEKHEAIFFDKFTALRYAVLQHGCADMVQEGIRELLLITLTDKEDQKL